MLADQLLTLDEVKPPHAASAARSASAVDRTAFHIEANGRWKRRFRVPIIQTLGYQDDEPPSPELLGYCDGFTQPNGVTHLETIEVRKFTGFWARRKERGAARYAATKKLNPGLLISLATACFIREKAPFGNTRAQPLCIRDERQHASLIRFYRRLGFVPIREVDDLRSIADKVVWGGDGTIMENQIDDLRRIAARKVRALGVAKAAEGRHSLSLKSFVAGQARGLVIRDLFLWTPTHPA